MTLCENERLSEQRRRGKEKSDGSHDGTEDFLLVDLGVIRNAAKYGGLDEIALVKEGVESVSPSRRPRT
jgi:hypothetical protein